ncbi:MAG TPA: type II toxin-antitoxin system PemK/MazF family toxin [Prolixibacteraceae bacterium]|jgi:mRNA interferase MazF|nr:type II toxin-antitoxin system PemK/MazF family toxin [Prolixibacteraceae bacterium]
MKFRKWTIWRANLDPIVGSEQGLTRPVLIISDDSINDLINTVNVIPITTRKINRVIYPNEVLLNSNLYGLTEESIALCHQIRTLDKKRFAKFYGEITDSKKQNEIIEALFFQLGIDNYIPVSL